ncbi:CIR protein, partial [Plasmodium chabaudi chabaudi]
MSSKLCKLLLDVDDLFTDGTVDVNKFNKPDSYKKYCPYENGKLRDCKNNYERINALGEYLYQKMPKDSDEFKGGGINDNLYIEFFMMWLSDKIFKVNKDYKATLKESYEKHLKDITGKFEYWDALSSKEVYKDATIVRMYIFYNLLNSICKTINELNKNLNNTDAVSLKKYGTQCRDLYRNIYESVKECKSYTHLLDSLKTIYEYIKSFKITDNTSIEGRKKVVLFDATPSLTTSDYQNKYFIPNDETLSFGNQECGRVKSKDEEDGKKGSLPDLQNIQGDKLPKKPKAGSRPKLQLSAELLRQLKANKQRMQANIPKPRPQLKSPGKAESQPKPQSPVAPAQTASPPQQNDPLLQKSPTGGSSQVTGSGNQGNVAGTPSSVPNSGKDPQNGIDNGTVNTKDNVSIGKSGGKNSNGATVDHGADANKKTVQPHGTDNKQGSSSSDAGIGARDGTGNSGGVTGSGTDNQGTKVNQVRGTSSQGTTVSQGGGSDQGSSGSQGGGTGGGPVATDPNKGGAGAGKGDPSGGTRDTGSGADGDKGKLSGVSGGLANVQGDSGSGKGSGAGGAIDGAGSGQGDQGKPSDMPGSPVNVQGDSNGGTGHSGNGADSGTNAGAGGAGGITGGGKVSSNGNAGDAGTDQGNSGGGAVGGSGGGQGAQNPASVDPNHAAGSSGGGSKPSGDPNPTHSSGTSNGYWLSNWGTYLNPMSYIPSVSDVYQAQKKIITNATNQVSSVYNITVNTAKDAYDKTVNAAKDAYDKTVNAAKNAYGSAVTAVKNTYDSTMTTVQGAYSATTNYVGGVVGSITNQLNPFGTSTSSDNQSGSGGTGSGSSTGSNPSTTTQIPNSDPNPSQQPSSPSSSSSTPPVTTPSPSPTSPTPQPAISQPQPNQAQDPLQSAVQKGGPIPSQSHGTNAGTGISQATANSSTGSSNTGNGSTTGIVKINEKPSIWCIGPNKKCDLVGISVIGVSISIFLAIMYKYLSFGSAKNSKKGKNMKRVINSISGKKKIQIIINSSTKKKQTKKSIKPVYR